MPGTWQNLTTQPANPVQRMLLLTDGSVLCYTGGADWVRYQPDDFGQYLAGSWRAVDRMQNERRNFGSVTLPDGRVMVIFGWPDYSSGRIDTGRGDNSIEFFDPTETAGRQWNRQDADPGWDETFYGQTHCCVLADGRIMAGTDIGRSSLLDFAFGHQSSVYNVRTGRWTLVDRGEGTGCDFQAWTLLRDESVLATNCRPNFRYIADGGAGRWVPAGAGIYSDVYIQLEGAGILLPDGRVWVVSRLGTQTQLYTPPSTAGETGSWTPGPEMLEQGGRPETNFMNFAACVLPSGKVLFTGTRYFDDSPQFFEFDPFSPGSPVIQAPQPEVEATRESNPGAVMLLLPTGQVLVSYLSRMFLYTPDRADAPPRAEWRPQMSSPADASILIAGSTYTARGTLFNGMTQAIAHNPPKSAGTATNFPIIRLTHRKSGRVWYCRTFNHSSMGVATGAAMQSTNFKVPDAVPEGEADLCIIVNGIVGGCEDVKIGRAIREVIIPKEVWQLIGSLADGPLFILGPGGIRPVPPFGPIINEKLYRQKIISAYQHVLLGLLKMNAATQYRADDNNLADVERDPELTGLGIKQIQHGLQMLRKIGDEVEGKIK